MKRFVYLLACVWLFSFDASSQHKVYVENSGEIIFSFANVEYMDEHVPTNMRFTMFLHLGQNFHYDFTENFGMYSGFGLRNIGLITDDNGIKTKRRTYALGIPLALKLGSFSDHFYVYGGGSYELFFHYKQKQFIEGRKTKYSEWFSDRTPRFAPAVFAGVQFPGGVNLKFKYYLTNFLNRDFTGTDFGNVVDYENFNETRIYYVALSFNFKKPKPREYNDEEKTVRFALNPSGN